MAAVVIRIGRSPIRTAPFPGPEDYAAMPLLGPHQPANGSVC